MGGPFGGLSPRHEPDGEARGLGLVLPGRAYSPAAPLLEFARLALLQHGFAVQQLWWDSSSRPADMPPGDWVAQQAAAALDAETTPPRSVVIVGKSLGARATPYAAAHGFAAVWLTPLLVEPSVVDGIRANTAPQLLVGGTADELWDTDVAAGLAREGCEVLEVPDADHGMCVAGDVARSAEIHAEVAARVAGFLAGLGRS